MHIQEDCESWWLSGCNGSVKEEVAQARGVLGLTPGGCRPSFFSISCFKTSKSSFNSSMRRNALSFSCCHAILVENRGKKKSEDRQFAFNLVWDLFEGGKKSRKYGNYTATHTKQAPHEYRHLF